MSSTTRANRANNPDESYPTPLWVTEAILPYLPLGGTVLEPCAGGGAIVSALLSFGVPADDVQAMEISLERCAKLRARGIVAQNCDALSAKAVWDDGHSLVIQNPPFSLAMEFVVRAIDAQASHGGTTATLLRLAWMSSIQRAGFHEANPSDVYVLDRRPSFAVSLKCKARRGVGTTEGCRFRKMIGVEAKRPKACPLCGSGIDVTTSDSADYAWFVTGPGRGGRWQVLASPQTATMKATQGEAS